MSKEDLYDLLYNIANGTGVELTARNQVYSGDFFLLRHGSSYSADDQITLENVVEIPSGVRREESLNFLVGEIQNVRVVSIGVFKNKKRDVDEQPITNVKPYSKSPSVQTKNNTNTLSKKKGPTPENIKDCQTVELQLKTFVIKEETELLVLMKLMKEVDIVGITLEGYNVGRFGQVPWVVMTARKTLLPFNIEKLMETVPDIWKVLEKNIFANDKLIKIMHDSRLAADYLFYRHKIQLVNVFDTQVADFYIKQRNTGVMPRVYDPLSDCLQLYNRRIPCEEIDFLRLYEKYNISNSVKWLERPLPPPECLKAAAIKVKHLIPLRENMLARMMETFSKLVGIHMETVRGKSNEDYTFQISLEVPKDMSTALD